MLSSGEREPSRARPVEKAATAALCAFLLWPPVHFCLCKVWGLNPWKFGGWAMYALPRPRVELLAQIERANGSWQDMRSLDQPPVIQALNRSETLMEFWGRLVRPEEIARDLFHSLRRGEPGKSGSRLRLGLTHWAFDGSLGRYVPRTASLECIARPKATCWSSPIAGRREHWMNHEPGNRAEPEGSDK
jgi:hypothetical protein